VSRAASRLVAGQLIDVADLVLVLSDPYAEMDRLAARAKSFNG
jgi:hypothetical protein